MENIAQQNKMQGFKGKGFVSRSSRVRDYLVNACLAVYFLISAGFANTTGSIVGQVIDAETKAPMIGANVYLDGTVLGSSTDSDGAFLIANIPQGTYTLVVAMIGYAENRVINLAVNSGKSTNLMNVGIRAEAIEGEAVTIEARFVQQTEAAVLTQRKKAESISDGLSAEAITRSGSGDAAEAMRQVTGASVIGGKYVYVRGLGERYASTQLNGVELPSADPDKRSFNLDLIPTNMLDNIVTTKTFTPNKPGNFSGGTVDLGMRSFPDKLNISFTTGVSWDSKSSLNSNFLTYPGSSTDWLGYDNGLRDLPDIVKKNTETIPKESSARRDATQANLLDGLSKAFTPVMTPTTREAPVNNNFSFSIGNQTFLGGKPLGFSGSFSYSRDFDYYGNGEVGRWKLTGKVSENDSLSRLIDLHDSKGTESVLWGGLGSVTYQLFPGNDLQVNYMRTQSGTSEARSLTGPWPEQNVQHLETQALTYKERALNSWQFRGNHQLGFLNHSELNWIASTAKSTQKEPDARFFSDTFSERKFAGRDTTIYSISPSIITRPSRYFRDMNENTKSFQVDFSVPLTAKGSDSNTKLKLGYYYEEKDREFTEDLFQYWQGNGVRYDGDAASFFARDNVGIIGYDSTRNTYQFGNYIQESLGGFGGNYQGDQRINATYLMLDARPFSKLRLVAGARLESTRMNVSNEDRSGALHDDDLLPSLNLTYLLRDDMNLRFAYGRTLARPNFREKAPYTSFQFAQDVLFSGNPDLKRTLINNYDIRWEWFVQPGEVLSVSGFYKGFKNPIERTIDIGFASEGALVRFANVDRAKVYGLEFELRKRLGVISNTFRNFMLGSNVTLIKSEVTIPDEELRSIQAVDPEAGNKRELQGQSPYLVNINLNYESPGSNTIASLYYNVFGSRLYEVALGGTPGVFERPRNLLNFTFSQKLLRVMTLKLSAKNILDEANKYSHEYKNFEYIRQFYRSGRSFSFSLQYSIN